jgi:hypothetical protein
MFSYVAIFGFLGFLVYASSFVYALLQRTNEQKKTGVRMMVTFIIMLAGIIGLQLTS